MTTSNRVPSRKVGRRAVLAGAGAGAALAATGPFIRTSRAQAKRIVFGTWGGSWEKAMREGWFDPFTKKTGIEITTVGGGNAYAKIRASVEAGKPECDIVEVNPDFQWIGPKDNLVEKLDPKVVDTSGIMKMPNLVTDYSVPQVLWSKVMFYNVKTFAPGSQPKNWAEVWDVKKFPGKRTFGIRTSSGGLEAALLADGVSMDKLFPMDVDRALKSLAKIRDHILWYDTNAQGEQYMTDGQAVLGLVPDGRALSAKKNGAPIDVEFNQSLMSWASMLILRGAPNKDAAMQFLNYAVSVEGQTGIAMAYTYGPVVQKAYEKIPKDRAVTLSGGPQQTGKFVMTDEKWWGENREAVQEKYNQWRLG
jgi:putative spermidine/putrescine transport system substrate-binding protein